MTRFSVTAVVLKVVGDVPSEATFCRYYEKLSEDDALDNLYVEMLDNALFQGLIDGNSVPTDSTDLSAYERPKGPLKNNL